MRGRVLVSVIAGCVPAVDEAPPSPAPAPAVKRIDAAVDAPPDAPPDARVLTRPGKLTCRWRQMTDMEEQRFHGVDPFVDLGGMSSSSCCLLPNATVLCTVSSRTYNYFGSASVPLGIQRVRLFDKSGAKPWLDLVIGIVDPGPMGPLRGYRFSPPVFEGHVEVDQDALWIVGDRDRVCDRKIPCDTFLIESGACGLYRKALAPTVKAFCDARGPHEWRGARLEATIGTPGTTLE